MNLEESHVLTLDYTVATVIKTIWYCSKLTHGSTELDRKCRHKPAQL